jgi:hypothetical protein
MKTLPVALILILALAAMAFGDTLISKPPDNGPWWNPIDNDGTYVYADGFYAPGGDDWVTELGTWLEPLGGAPMSIVRFEVWGTIAGGPDCTNIFATTDPYYTELPGLNLHTLPAMGLQPLATGDLYWFVITAVGMGEPNFSAYRVGGHTQNSVYVDNCTFWYSNDPAGCSFDGQNLTPEMAFEVLLTGATGTEDTSWSIIKALY